jgi:hypothetical protein
MKVNVKNMTSPQSGNEVANQFIITIGRKVYFQSYDTIIAVKDYEKGTITLDKNHWNYSTTTGKYRNEFLNERIADTRRKIESKEYKLRDLNK